MVSWKADSGSELWITLITCRLFYGGRFSGNSLLQAVVCCDECHVRQASVGATGVADSIVRRAYVVLRYSNHTACRARSRESTRSFRHFHLQNERALVAQNGTRQANFAPSSVFVARNVFMMTALRLMQRRAPHADDVLVGAQLTDGWRAALVVFSAGAADEADGGFCGQSRQSARRFACG